MSDSNVDPTKTADAGQPANDDGAKGAAAGAAPNAGEPDAFTVIESLNVENTGLKDKVLRTMAEMENLRRRTEKEVADARTYGMANFAREMLSVADNLHRAVASVPAGAREASDAVRTLVEGVELTEKDLVSRLARFGVKALEPEGKKFDPNMHEALFEVPDESVPAGTVMQVVERGYAIGERVLRPAKVGVSRGGPRSVN